MARARQQQIPGTERKTNKKIAGAARVYVDARDTRMEHTNKEKEAKAALIQVMRAAGETSYRDDSVDPPLLITLSEGKADVKVHEVKEAGEVVEDEDGDE